MNGREVVIVSGVRTAIGTFGGSLKGTPPTALGAAVTREAMRAQDLHLCLSYDITEQRQLEDDLFKRAYFDNLTGLPNRGFLEKIVASLTERPESVFALAFVDLDGFKNVNDYYGHAVGDSLLVKIAERLTSELRPSDMRSPAASNAATASSTG